MTGGAAAGVAETVSAVELDDNEGATCVALVRFDTAGYAGTYLAVGTAQGLSFNPRQADGEARQALSSRHCVRQLTKRPARSTCTCRTVAPLSPHVLRGNFLGSIYLRKVAAE